jgi:hypothetical protein
MVAIHLKKDFPLIDKDFPYSQPVKANGKEGYFQEWVDNGDISDTGERIRGGLLN